MSLEPSPDRKRAEAAHLREVVRKVPPLPERGPQFPVEPPLAANPVSVAKKSPSECAENCSTKLTGGPPHQMILAWDGLRP
jgi:hypothetical protein